MGVSNRWDGGIELEFISQKHELGYLHQMIHRLFMVQLM